MRTFGGPILRRPRGRRRAPLGGLLSLGAALAVLALGVIAPADADRGDVIVGAEYPDAAGARELLEGDDGRRLRARQLDPGPNPSAAWFSWTMNRPGSGRDAPTQRIRAAALGADAEGDATAALQQGIDACFARTLAAGAASCELILTPGHTYRVTNLTIRWLSHDFTIVGRGATLLFSRDSLDPPPRSPDDLLDNLTPPLINVESCRRCEFRDLVVDWDWEKWRIASVGMLVGTKADDGSGRGAWTFDIVGPPAPPGGLDPATLRGPYSIHPLDPNTMGVGLRGVPEFYFARGTATGTFDKRDGAGGDAELEEDYELGAKDPESARVVRGGAASYAAQKRPADGSSYARKAATTSTRMTITFDRRINGFGTEPSPVGSYWMIKHLTYDVHGFRLAQCRHCFLTNVRILSVPGKAVIIDRGSGEILIDGLAVEPAERPTPTSARPMSGAADGVWGSMTTGNIMVANSRFFFLGDDPINIHLPTSLRGFRYAFDRSGATDYAMIVLPRTRAWRMYFAVGDTVEFLRAADLSTTGTTRRIIETWYDAGVEGGTWQLQLDAPLDPSADAVFADPSLCGVMLPRWNARNVVVRNVTTGFHRARGVLLQVRENAVVEGCAFRRVHMSAVLAQASGYAQEGVGVRGLAVVNNRIDNADVVGRRGAVVVDAVDASMRTVGNRDGWGNAGVLVSGNRVAGAPRWAVLADAVAGVEVSGNRVVPARDAAGISGRIMIANSGEWRVVNVNNTRCEADCGKRESWTPM